MLSSGSRTRRADTLTHERGRHALDEGRPHAGCRPRPSRGCRSRHGRAAVRRRRGRSAVPRRSWEGGRGADRRVERELHARALPRRGRSGLCLRRRHGRGSPSRPGRQVRDSGLRVLADLAGTVPDGVALTAEGGYVVSCYYPFHIYYVPPEGGAAELLLDDATGTQFPMPTNVCFFGDGLATLAVASLGG